MTKHAERGRNVEEVRAEGRMDGQREGKTKRGWKKQNQTSI